MFTRWLVRGNGNIHRLLKHRLDQHHLPCQPSKVRLALGDNLTKPAVRDDLLESGAVGWYLWESLAADVRTSVEVSGHPQEPTLPPDEPVLIHCTRRAAGPWPDESPGDRLDNLILAQHDIDHSAWATLKHIVETRRLIASDTSTRGSTRVVSFTSVPLAELHRLHVFRSHRTRWDFEPYGIAIRQNVLAARPVSYASHEEWRNVLAGRPTVLSAPSISDPPPPPQTGSILDWTVEQEWRHVGDLDLTALRPDHAFLFVPTLAEADQFEGGFLLGR